MKIAIDARLYGLENAGLGRYVMNLIHQLSAIDTANSYIVLLRKKYYDSLNLPSNWKKVLADFRHYSLKEQVVLPLILYKERPTITHFPHFNVPLLYFGKYLVTIHDLIMHQFDHRAVTTLSPLFFRLKRLGYKLIFKRALSKSSFVIVPSQEVKKEIGVTYPQVSLEKIIPLYEGYNLEPEPKVEAEGILRKYSLSQPFFVYFGNVYPHKNIDFLIDGIKKLNGLGKKVMLFLSSPNNFFSERLKERIKNESLEEIIKFPGFVSDEELHAILLASSGFIYPSLLEGFGLQGIEALNMGVLVIASDIPVFKEIYQNKVIYFDPKNLDSLLGAINKALSIGENEKEEWVRQGKEFVKVYSWSKMARETLEVYMRI